MANGLVEVNPQVLFIVRVANLSDSTVIVPKNQKLGTVVAAPVGRVLSITFEGDYPSDTTADEPQAQSSTSRLETKSPPKLTADDISL